MPEVNRPIPEIMLADLSPLGQCLICYSVLDEGATRGILRKHSQDDSLNGQMRFVRCDRFNFNGPWPAVVVGSSTLLLAGVPCVTYCRHERKFIPDPTLAGSGAGIVPFPGGGHR